MEKIQPLERTQDLHILECEPLVPPCLVKDEYTVTPEANRTVVDARLTIKKMLRNKDSRVLVVVGPCSIHDEKAAYEYAERLNALRREVEDRLYLVMRVYFEKPRTTVGWKGLINDPKLDGTSDIETGLRIARRILLNINTMGVPAATEFLDPIVPQYIADLVAWAAIGARTTESQTHREMSSGLSMPVGFKNSTEGNLQIAMDAMQSARSPHTFLGVDQNGQTSIFRTTGNVWGHIILRGGRQSKNYDPQTIQETLDRLKQLDLPQFIMVDCSHGNSEKKHENQTRVFLEMIRRRVEGELAVGGLMLESNLYEGNQKIHPDISQLRYGVSITDACVDWDTTEKIIRESYAQLALK